jgi:transcriptional regulator with XRE-family HTH domain
MAAVVLPPPKTGRDFARARILMGVSGRQAARALGVASNTLYRWESYTTPIDADDASC